MVATTPKASTLRVDTAAAWYREQFNKVASMIDKSLSIEAQIIQAEKLQQQLMEGAVAALDDPQFANTLREAFARPSIEKLLAEVGGAGEKQLKAVLDKLTAPDTTRKWFEPGACFAAGTLVHTKEGLKPIEQIQVGDYVLSKHDSGTGEQAYKRVLQTFYHPSETVIEVYHAHPHTPNSRKRIVCTPNHPIWVAEVRSADDQPGWTAASRLSNSWSGGGSKFELADSSRVRASGWLKIYATAQEGVGWTPQKMGDRQDIGAIFDYGSYRVIEGKIVSYQLIAQEVLANQELRDWALEHDHPFYEVPEHFLLKLPVYNLEVEDFHTYYVGEYGVWVHNQNCGGLTFEQQPSSVAVERVPELTAALKNNPYLSVASLRRQLELRMPNLAEREGFTETVMIRAGKESQVEDLIVANSEIKNWLKFEEGVSGRIKSSDGVRWEYGKVFWDPVKGEFNVIRVEGVGLSPSGNLVQNIDRKLGFVKAGDTLEVLKLLDRIAKFLENPKNANERWVFEFPPGIRKPDLVGIRKAREFFADIRNQVERFGKDGFDANGEGIWIETAEEAASNARIRKMLDVDDAHSLVELRNAGTPTIFPQNVITEGASASIAPLTLADINAVLPAAHQYWLSVGASASMLNSATFQIADLPTGFAGQTQGKTITLDASGAGWGWYVDSTPAVNTEFDAAATAMDFNAPLSSEAYGKLDLLTVMIHELGHVLGMPSTVSADNVMSQYLAPGQRRLPDAVDIAALQAGGSPYFVGGTTGTTATVPPGTPPGNAGVVVTNLQIPAGVFDPNSWRTQGSVTSNATGGSATLSESASTQTRLNQVFMVGPQDRYLSFTLSGIALDDAVTGPDDALEVALLDANSGASLVGPIGMTHTDALLNLQANGAELAASGVTHVTNQDGSRTYLVDLTGVATGTAVNLSFDLIGFGNTAPNLGSHATVSQVRLLAQKPVPQTVDDSSSVAEDTVAHIIALANDLDTNQVGMNPVVVTGAMHGQVVVNADGSFDYTPDANFFGTDSFTYRIDQEGNSAVQSNVSTVSITITPVNDAPVAPDLGGVQATVAEDATLTIDLLAQATDVEGDTLTTALVAGPQHGTLSVNADGTFSYAADANYFGSDSFTYRVTDGSLESGIATVNLTITAVNDAPVAADVQATVLEDGTVAITLVATDVDNTRTELQFSIQTQPAHGVLIANANGTYSYTPAANFNGTDSFTYTVTDGNLVSNVATARITITAVNDAPVLAGDSLSLSEDNTLVIDPLKNASDVDSAKLVASVVTGPQHGSLIVNTNGGFNYIPDANFFGADSFTYLVTDGDLNSGTATVSLTVTAVNDAPTLGNQALVLAEDSVLAGSLMATATDVDSTTLSAAIVARPQHGTLSVDADGTFSYTVTDGDPDLSLSTIALTATGPCKNCHQSRRLNFPLSKIRHVFDT